MINCPSCKKKTLRPLSKKEIREMEVYIINTWSITNDPYSDSIVFVACPHCGFLDFLGSNAGESSVVLAHLTKRAPDVKPVSVSK